MRGAVASRGTEPGGGTGRQRHASSLAEAARLARSGRYAEACRALDGLGGAGSDDPAVLDLLARIHAQRGEFAEADACWARVAEMTPRVAAGTAAGAGRRRIAALQAGRHRAVTGRRLGAAALALVAAGAVAAGAVLPRPPGQDPAVRRDLAAVRDGQARLARQLGALRARVDAVADRPAPAPPAPRPDPDPDP